MQEQNHYVYEFGPFHLNASRRVLLKDGEPVKLFPKEFDTLLALVEHNGEVVEKDDLMRHVWQDQIVEESNLTTNISHLRKLLGEKRGSHDYIVTIPGRGYRFVAGVSQAFDEVIIRERTRVTVEEEIDADPSQTHEIAARGTGNQIATRNNAVEAGSPAPTSQSTESHSKYPFPSLMIPGVVAVAVIALFATFLVTRFLFSEPHTAFRNVILQQLTTNSKATIVTLSPDGKLFLYVSRANGQEGLWLGHVSGGEPVRLRPDGDVTYRTLKVSVDGSTLYYVLVSDEHPQGALFRMPVFGGVPQKLRDNIGVTVAFAPDMKQVAFVRGNSERKVSSVVIADTDGTGERELVSRDQNVPFRVLSPSWSPDGKMIVVAATTDELGGTYELFVVTVPDGQIRPLTALSWVHVTATTWLPDMSGVIAIAKEKGVLDGFQLWNVSYPDGKARRILSDLDNYGSAISLSADGQALATVQEQRITNVWVAPAADVHRAKQVTFSSIGRRDGWQNLDWTSDGRLLYGAILRDSLTIWTMNSDGSNQKQLTSAGYTDVRLSTTFDGRYMVFQSNRGGGAEIWRANLDGSDMKQLTHGGHNADPHVSPDGKWVVYTSMRDGQWRLWRVSIEGGEPVQLSDKPASEPRVSPDGKLIACAYTAHPHSRRQLAIIPIGGGSPVKVFDVARLANFSYSIRWTPDAKAVTYRDWANGIWRQPVAGGLPERLEGLPKEKLYSYGWSRDGQQFAFVRGTEIRDVVLLRDVK